MANAPTASIVLTDELFGELKSVPWPLRGGSLVHAIIRKLAAVMGYNADQIEGLYENLETKVLVGIDKNDGASESLVGWLYGIVPNLVLYSNSLLEDDPLAGLLQRGSDGRLYQVRPFHDGASVRIYNSTEMPTSGWTRCPAFMVGSLHGSQVLPTVGFPPWRWEMELRLWLDRWLLKT